MPTGAIPPELPPSVEAAYRAKCIQLKTRLNEVEEANDAARLRISRIHRAIQKTRLERAFLLEQLAKRTSTNVEDSEGSPSPPPTVGLLPTFLLHLLMITDKLTCDIQPKEKPLRTKRGHRKPDFLTTDLGDGRPGSAFVNAGPTTYSPSSDAFSHTHPDPLRNSTPQASQAAKRPPNGYVAPVTSAPTQLRRPRTAFDLFCNETRPILGQEGVENTEQVLATRWATLDNEKKDEYTQRVDQMKRAAEAEKEVGNEDEDVEMGDEAPDAGGFTAVNRH